MGITVDQHWVFIHLDLENFQLPPEARRHGNKSVASFQAAKTPFCPKIKKHQPPRDKELQSIPSKFVGPLVFFIRAIYSTKGMPFSHLIVTFDK